MSGTVPVDLVPMEIEYLAELIGQYRELVSAPPGSPDPAIERLTPAAYPGDAEASAEFRGLTRDDLLSARAADADRVLADLRSDEDAAPTSDRQPRDGARRLLLDDAGQSAWLRTLAGLRLVLAARLDIVDDAADHSDDPRYGVYEWLGYRLEALLQSMDA